MRATTVAALPGGGAAHAEQVVRCAVGSPVVAEVLAVHERLPTVSSATPCRD